MKNLFLFKLLILLLVNSSTYSQSIGQAEILVKNDLNQNVNFIMYPVSAVFNGRYLAEGNNYKYSFYPSRRETGNKYWKIHPDAIVGGNKLITPSGHVVLDFDDGDYYENDTVNIIGGFGYGLWKLEFSIRTG